MALTHDQADILREMVNIGVGRAAGMLNEMTDAYVRLEVPFVKLLTAMDLEKEMISEGIGRLAAVQLGFKGVFSGVANLVFPPESASNLVAVLTGEEAGTAELDAVKAGTLEELGNIVINGVMGSLSNLLKMHTEYALPSYTEDTIKNLLRSESSRAEAPVLLARTRFQIEQLNVEGDIILIFEVGSLDGLLAAIDSVRTGV